MKAFLNVMGCIFASLLSILLVVMLLVFPVFRAVTSVATASTLTDIVQNIDYTALLPSSDEVKEMIGEDWEEVPVVGDILKDDALDQVVDGIMKSDAVGEIIELYADDVVNTVMQNGKEKQLTPEALIAIAAKESRSLIQIIRPYIPEAQNLSDEELSREIQTYVSENSEQILSFLPDIAELTGTDGTVEDIIGGLESGEIDPEDIVDEFEDGTYTYRPEDAHAPASAENWDDDPFALIRQLLAPSVSVTFIVVIVVLALLIALCRFNRFGGLLWLGIDTLIAAVPVALLAIAIKGTAIAALLGEEQAAVSALVSSLTVVFSRKLTVAAVIYVVIGAAAITGYVLLRKFVKNKTASAESLPEETVVQE